LQVVVVRLGQEFRALRQPQLVAVEQVVTELAQELLAVGQAQRQFRL
jgi:hypothetical protein